MKNIEGNIKKTLKDLKIGTNPEEEACRDMDGCNAISGGFNIYKFVNPDGTIHRRGS